MDSTFVILGICFFFTLLYAKLYKPKQTEYSPIQEKYPQPLMPSTDHSVTEIPVVQTLQWDTPKQAYHATRVTCDEMGLSVGEKNIICACIYQESQFNNEAVGRNRNSKGEVTSTDWGLVQINDYFNIGTGKPFPTVKYVLDNPEACVRWMIAQYRAGHLYLWSSYKFGAYKKWLEPNSPMWGLSA